MGFFHFDESLHPRAQFALGAFVYSEETIDASVSEALQECGIVPVVEEFKSGVRMDRNPRYENARNRLKVILSDKCGIGVVIAPASPRHLLGGEAFHGLNKILSTTTFRSKMHNVFFDQGIFPSVAVGEQAAKRVSFAQPCKLYFEQDSKRVMGLQVADLVAHMCSMMLLAELGVTKKTVKVDPDSGYDQDMPLEFELFATLRHKFFANSPPPIDTWKSQLDYQADVASSGLHIADACDRHIKESALSRFGKMYLGCIH